MTQRTSFAKLQRDRDRQARAAAKRDRRQERQAEAAEAVDAPLPQLTGAGAELTASELLAAVAAVHRQFEEEAIDFETFEQTKADLLARLPVD